MRQKASFILIRVASLEFVLRYKCVTLPPGLSALASMYAPHADAPDDRACSACSPDRPLRRSHSPARTSPAPPGSRDVPPRFILTCPPRTSPAAELVIGGKKAFKGPKMGDTSKRYTTEQIVNKLREAEVEAFFGRRPTQTSEPDAAAASG